MSIPDSPDDPRPALFAQLDAGFAAYQAALDEVRTARDRQIELMIELTVFREVSYHQITKELGFGSHETVAKRVRPVLAEYDLVPAGGRTPTTEHIEEMTDRYGGRKWARSRTRWLLDKVVELEGKFAELEERPRHVLRTEALPAASALVDLGVPVMRLGQRPHAPRRTVFREALLAYRAGQGRPAPRRGAHRPSTW